MNGRIRGLALGLALFAVAPAPQAATPQPEAASATADATCKKAPEPAGDGEVQQGRYVSCMIGELGFDPGLYFRTTVDTDDASAPGGIVDARHAGGRGGPSWSFAIDVSCPGSVAFPAPCKEEAARLVIRVVSLRRPGAFPSRPEDGSPPAIRAYLDAMLDWREADIKTCPNAARTLLSLERARWFVFDDWDRAAIVGGQADVVVPGDGPSTVVRARGFASNYVAQDWSDAGAASAWAKRMMKVVESCLTPSSAPAPWDRS